MNYLRTGMKDGAQGAQCQGLTCSITTALLLLTSQMAILDLFTETRL